eukprot:TRINITY_DN9860_c1_g1_i1.p1 TRINITY_DN9860_c1_g1~~TRINITY_DN9860_c1_g1_i1.p1  ORF type:complete len:650 (+),score=161.05 TRINITY_DN9860_c1_g1_i1:64-2013(+)
MAPKKKQTHAMKLHAALEVSSDKLEATMKPFKVPLEGSQGAEVLKDTKLLVAWVKRMDEELEKGDFNSLYHLLTPFSMQIYRVFEQKPKVVKESGLVTMVIKAIKKLTPLGESEAKCFSAVLDIADVINEETVLRTELFLAVVDELIEVGCNPSISLVNRRTCLQMIRTAGNGNEKHRDNINVEQLASFLLVADDFISQLDIAVTLGKLVLKKEAKVAPILRRVCGNSTADLLIKHAKKDLDTLHEFVCAINQENASSLVKTLRCTEWLIGNTKFTGTTEQLLVHCTPTFISFLLPLEDEEGEVEAVDIPIATVQRCNVTKKTSQLILDFKPKAKLPPSIASCTTGDKFKIVFKASDVKEMTSWTIFLANHKNGRKTTSLSVAREASKRKSSHRDDNTEIKRLQTRTPGSDSKMSEGVRKTMGMLTQAADDFTDVHMKSQHAEESTFEPPQLLSRMNEVDPSPFAKQYNLDNLEGEAEGADLDVAIDALRKQFANNAAKRQEKGKQALFKTMNMVQSLVDDYKSDSSRRDARLQENVDLLQGETERLEREFTACYTREKQLTKEIEGLHSEFHGKAKEHRDNMVSFQTELETVLSNLRDQEGRSLSKLKAMVKDEFIKLEDQVNKIQSQKSAMTKIMSFMMSQLNQADE